MWYLALNNNANNKRGSVGAALSSNPKLGGVFFTGSVPTGERIAQAAAKNLIKVQLELGGLSCVHVL